MKKVSLAFLLLALLALLVCCGGNGTTSQSTETTAQTEPPIEDGEKITVIKRNEPTLYRIVYAENAKDQAVWLMNKLNETYSCDIKAYSLADDAAKTAWNREILIGLTDRAESIAENDALAGTGYAVKVHENGKITVVVSHIEQMPAAVERLQGKMKTGTMGGVMTLKKNDTAHYQREAWTLHVPEYLYGTIGAGNLDCGPDFNDLDMQGATMQIINDTTLEEFKKYEASLASYGYVMVSENEMAGNRYVTYEKEGAAGILYASFVPSQNAARIVEDTVSVPEYEFEYHYDLQDGDTVTLYQYAMMNDPTGNRSTLPSGHFIEPNGALFVIRLADNRLILIDGGAEYQVNGQKEIVGAFVDFLREISETPEGEKIKIAAWIGSHPHQGDHFAFMRRTMEWFSDQVLVERFMANFAPKQTTPLSDDYKNAWTKVLQGNPDAMFLKPHTGQKIEMGGVVMEIVTTHEDQFDTRTGEVQYITVNNSGTMIKFTFPGGKTFMMAGDWATGEETKPEQTAIVQQTVLSMFKNTDFLKCDIVQAMHHGRNLECPEVFKAFAGKYVLVNGSDASLSTMVWLVRDAVQQLKDCGATNFYFQSRYTWGFTFSQDGEMEITSEPIRSATEEYLEIIQQYPPFKNN